MSSAGFFNNYIKGRDNMYSSLERRRERIAKTAGSESSSLADELQEDIGELKLATATLINVLIAKGVVNETELMAQAEIIDAMDGKSDGQFNGTVQPDGKIAPDQPKARTALDDLAEAADHADAEFE